MSTLSEQQRKQILLNLLADGKYSQCTTSLQAKYNLVAEKLMDLEKRNKIEPMKVVEKNLEPGKTGKLEWEKFSERLVKLIRENPKSKVSLGTGLDSKSEKEIEAQLHRLDLVYEHRKTSAEKLSPNVQRAILSECLQVVGEYRSFKKDAFLGVLNGAYQDVHGYGALEAHHIPPSESLEILGMNSKKGIACLMYRPPHTMTISHGHNGMEGQLHRLDQALRIVNTKSRELAVRKDIEDLQQVCKKGYIPPLLHRDYQYVQANIFKQNLAPEKEKEVKQALSTTKLKELRQDMLHDKLVLKARLAQHLEQKMQADGKDEYQQNIKVFQALNRQAEAIEHEIDRARAKGNSLTVAAKRTELQTVSQDIQEIRKDVQERLDDLNLARAESYSAHRRLERFEAKFKDPIRASLGDLEKRRATVEKENLLRQQELEKQQRQYQAMGYSI